MGGPGASCLGASPCGALACSNSQCKLDGGPCGRECPPGQPSTHASRGMAARPPSHPSSQWLWHPRACTALDETGEVPPERTKRSRLAELLSKHKVHRFDAGSRRARSGPVVGPGSRWASLNLDHLAHCVNVWCGSRDDGQHPRQMESLLGSSCFGQRHCAVHAVREHRVPGIAHAPVVLALSVGG